jgi:hypothetical protein
MGHATTDTGTGVYGNSTGGGYGVRGETNTGTAVQGQSFGNGLAGSFIGDVNVNGIGIFNAIDATHPLAGWFSGNVEVTGTLNAGTKAFKIDHPLDPANKYLLHAAVEAPDMTTVYNGNVNTDGNGDATVILPDYFEALNADFRYQLTVIGQFAQAIVAREIHQNRFAIKTDKPNVKVSWQVTGIRQDPYAKANPMAAEQDKPAAERGSYLHPELYGQPADKKLTRGRVS